MKKAMPLNSLAFVIDEECMIIIAISAVVMRPNHVNDLSPLETQNNFGKQAIPMLYNKIKKGPRSPN